MTIIDITQLYHWQGKLTGIPRVMFELTSRFLAESPDDVKTVVWNHQSGAFEDVEWTPGREYTSQTNTEATYTILKPIYYRAARKMYNMAPRRVQVQLEKLRGYNDSGKQGAGDTGYRFQRDDKLVVVWGEWGDSRYRACLAETVNANGIQLYQFAHDMIPLVLPQFSGHSTEALNLYAREIYPLCAAILCVSKNTLHDVKTWMSDQRLDIPKLSFIRLGDDFSRHKDTKPTNMFFEKKTPYIMTLGTLEARKNHTILYYTYKLAVSRGVDLPKLVFVGRRGWMTENFYEFATKDPLVKDKFLFLHDASDSELSWIINHALFTIYPSFYEGWGLPIAESISRGVPCIASNSSSMPEVAGDAVMYFNPASTDECLDAIVRMLDGKNREKFTKRTQTYRPTSWDATYDVVRSIVYGKK